MLSIANSPVTFELAAHAHKYYATPGISSKNGPARNIQILQVFYLQDLQDLTLNLASLVLKMKLFLQNIKILLESCKKQVDILIS